MHICYQYINNINNKHIVTNNMYVKYEYMEYDSKYG